MSRSDLALRVLDRCGSWADQEALVGDLMEEIAHGRSRFWLWQQLIGLCGLAAVAQARCVRITPCFVALALGLAMLGGAAIAPTGKVVETWMFIYLVAGTLSLFGHLMCARTLDSRALVSPVDSE